MSGIMYAILVLQGVSIILLLVTLAVLIALAQMHHDKKGGKHG